MILRHSLFRAHRAEQCFLLYVEASHRQYRRIGMLSVDLAEIWDFFNSLLDLKLSVHIYRLISPKTLQLKLIGNIIRLVTT